MSDQDRTFMKNFSWLLAGLAVFTVVIAIVAANLNNLSNRPENPNTVTELESRIAPVGQVYAGDTGRQALADAEAAKKATMKVAFDGSTDGAMIYAQVCSVCHQAGVAGAPTMDKSAWESRITQGTDVLITHAIEGYQGSAGLMPARGGRPDLSDEQVQVTVEWMISQLQ